MIIRHIVFILKPICLFNIFLISNKTFIEKKLNIMCTMVNTLNKKTKTKRSRAKGNRTKKSDTVRTLPNTSPKKQSTKK